MKQFFKFTFASCLGCLISGVLLIFFLIGVIGSAIPSGETASVEIKDNSVLRIELNRPVYDREVSDISMLGGIVNGEINSPIGLTEFIVVLKKAKTDKSIKSVLLDLSPLQTYGWATVEEMRQALLDFKKSGKKVYAYGDVLTQSSYYLATAADEIYLNPAGMLTIMGLGAEVVYYKDLLSKFDVDVDLIRPKNNSYKSAGESYVNNKMSSENREQIKTYLNSIWNYVSDNIVKSRGLDSEQFNSKVSSLEYFLPKDALRLGMIDGLNFKTDVEEIIVSKVRKQFGIGDKAKVNFVKYSRYRESIMDIFKPAKENIAIVYAYGGVNQGKGSDLTIGSETIVKAIREAVENKSVKAIVFRVNSPGGDAVASELITNEIIKAKKIKPVIVSMGDVAASAGYEMSSNASKILASPVTITGSIGVFGVLPNFARTLKNNLGITFDTVKTHDNSIALSLTTPVSETARLMMHNNVENFYDNFLTRVATGRNLSKTFVDSVARGRVWSGADAEKIGLIDEFGGIEKSIAAAALAGNLKSYGLVAYPKAKDLATQIIESFSGETDMKLFTKQLGKPYSFFLELKDICQMQGVQARMPYLIRF